MKISPSIAFFDSFGQFGRPGDDVWIAFLNTIGESLQASAVILLDLHGSQMDPPTGDGDRN